MYWVRSWGDSNEKIILNSLPSWRLYSRKESDSHQISNYMIYRVVSSALEENKAGKGDEKSGLGVVILYSVVREGLSEMVTAERTIERGDE